MFYFLSTGRRGEGAQHQTLPCLPSFDSLDKAKELLAVRVRVRVRVKVKVGVWVKVRVGVRGARVKVRVRVRVRVRVGLGVRFRFGLGLVVVSSLWLSLSGRPDVSFNILFAVPDLYLNVFIHFDTFWLMIFSVLPKIGNFADTYVS